MAAMLLSLLPFAAGCSTLPPRQWPLMQLGAVVAAYPVVAGAAIPVPVSSTELTILSLSAEPTPQAERWEQGHRWLVPPPQCDVLVVTCRYRAYARDGAVPTPQQLFPGADVTVLAP